MSLHIEAFAEETRPYVFLRRVENITSNSAVVRGVAYVEPSGRFIECGVEYSIIQNDSQPLSKISPGEDIVTELTGLYPNKDYYARVYAKYRRENGVITYARTEWERFKTINSTSVTSSPSDCVVNVPRLTAITPTEVSAESNYFANGSAALYAGFVYSSSVQRPTRENTMNNLYDQVNGDSATFSRRLVNLRAGESYYVRAYVTISVSPSKLEDVYSEPILYNASYASLAEAITDSVSDVTLTGANVSIKINAKNVTERGVVYSTESPLPELYSTSSKAQSIAGTSDEATVTLAGLEPLKTHYVRAYARKEGETEPIYGDIKSFVTQEAPSTVTQEVLDITQNSAVVFASVSNVSAFILRETGVVYSSESTSPTLNDIKAESASRSSVFNVTLTALERAKRYYVRAYAIVEDVVSYGNVISFSTTGATVSIDVIYKDESGSVVGRESIGANPGDGLYETDLNVPEGYSLYDDEWMYVVTNSAPIDVIVKPNGNAVISRAFMDGIGGMRFAPERPITRYEVAKIIYNLADDKETTVFTGEPFSDASDSHVAKDAIDYVAAKGIMIGYPDGTFKPNATITRAEISVVLAIVYELKGSPKGEMFSDVKTGDWFYPYVTIAAENKMLYGYPDNTFKPQNTTTRAEGCALFVNSEKRALTPLSDLKFLDVTPDHWAYKYIMSASIPRD
jgi:hypothetical protein